MFKTDIITTRSGEKLGFEFLGHGSLGIEFEGKIIYIDPVGMFADYSKAPKADIILITHQHDDHLDSELVKKLSKESTRIISTRTVVEQIGRGEIMDNGDRLYIDNWIEVEATPAHNGPDRQQFHPNTGRDNGYLLTIGGSRIYVSGDSEPTPYMESLKDIDVAFLPVNQPYTMTVDQAVETVKTINPKIFYPYHYGQTDQKTDIRRLEQELEGSGIDVRIRPME